MPRILTILQFLMWSYSSFASDTTIVFRHLNYSDLFPAAKMEQKGVMLYFHFDGCGACVNMEKTAFRDKQVIDFFSTNFVSFEINTQKGEGVDINKIYNIRLHPTFIFFDREGNEIHRLVGVFTPEEFLQQAKDALFTKRNLTDYTIQYNTGNREAEFLYQYTYMLRDAHALDSVVVREYLNVLDIDDYKLEKNIQYIYEFCIHNFKIFIPFDHPAFDCMLHNKELFFQHVDSNQVKTRIVWILNNVIYNAIEQSNEKTFRKAIDLLKEYDHGEQYLFKEMDGRITGMIASKNLVLSSMLRYYDKMGDHSNYMKTLEMYISKIWDDADQLNQFAWNVFEQDQDDHKEKIAAAIQCSIRSIELDDNYNNNDTYAWLLYKSGDKEKALEQALKTIHIAKNINQNYNETQKLVDLIQHAK